MLRNRCHVSSPVPPPPAPPAAAALAAQVEIYPPPRLGAVNPAGNETRPAARIAGIVHQPGRLNTFRVLWKGIPLVA